MRKIIIKTAKERKKTRVRARIKEANRDKKLTVFRSNRYIWAQIIDLSTGKTLVTSSDKSLLKEKKRLAGKNKTEKAFEVGREIAKKAVKLRLKKVVFDRGCYRYHGRVKALAEGAKAEGLLL